MARDIEQTILPSQKTTFRYRDSQRTYLHYLPLGHSSEKKYPLVMILHGSGANAENALRMADMERLADKEKFVLLYPDGSGQPGDRVYTWNSGHCCGFSHENNIDDSGFLMALIDDFIRNHSIDRRRVHAAGFSNGAMMAYRLACEYSDRMASIAAVSGSMNYQGTVPADPVSVIAFHGTADDYAPCSGGENTKSRYPRFDQPARDSVFYWAKHNGCDLKPKEECAGNVKKIAFTGGRDGSEVIFYTLEGGKHSWPGGKDGARYGNVEPPAPDISATEMIWDFFKKHYTKSGGNKTL
jgi:polyhydroxybutyrate depolymerase